MMQAFQGPTGRSIFLRKILTKKRISNIIRPTGQSTGQSVGIFTKGTEELLLRPSLDERRDYIGNIAAVVFCEKGYQTASLQDVAKRAQLSKAGIYHYFKSKEEILAYRLVKYTDEFLQTLEKCISQNQEKGYDPQQSFQELIRTYAKYLNSNKEVRLLVLRERHQLTGRNKKEILKREQAIFHLLKNELKKIPHVDRKFDLNVVSFLIISMSHWLGYWFKENRYLNMEQIINQNIGVIFNGIFRKNHGQENSNISKQTRRPAR